MGIKPKGMAGEIPVYCSHDEIVNIEKLVKNPRNPNTHPESQIKALSKIIQAQGWRSPVTVSKRSGFIVKGHGRVDSAILGGLECIPVDYQDYATEADEWADLIADNRISELSTMDDDILYELLSEMSDMDADLLLTGFDENEIFSLLSDSFTETETNDSSLESEEEKEEDDFNYKEQYGVIVMCRDEQEQEKIYNHLCEQGYECKVVAT